MAIHVVRRKEVQPDPWGVGTNRYERTMWHLITPQVGAKHFWFAYQEIPPGRMGLRHIHVWEEMYYILRGVATFEEEDGTKVQVHPDECVFFPPGEYHQPKNEGDVTLAFVWVYAPPPETVTEGGYLQLADQTSS